MAFFAERKLKKISLSGGIVATLADASGAMSSSNSRGSWGSDDTIFFSAGFNVMHLVQSLGTNASGDALFRVSASGGQSEVLAQPNSDKGEFGYYNPWILPGGKAVLFTIWDGNEKAQIAALLLESRGAENSARRGTSPSIHFFHRTFALFTNGIGNLDGGDV